MASPGTHRALWLVPEEKSHGRYGHRRAMSEQGASAFSLSACFVVTNKGQQGPRAKGIAVMRAAKTDRLAYKISPMHRESQYAGEKFLI
jgi:hypothetical protein